jgi:rSAM/selenodomain-associated transferase 2
MPATNSFRFAGNLSVIIPAVNEAALIADFLGHLRGKVPGAELIVVDGGSEDDTATLASQLADRVLQCARGRARQMNAGAAVASGQVLWFLHADSVVPDEPCSSIASALDDEKTAGGCFRLKFPRREWVYRVSDALGNVAVDLFQIALGDHGIFCRREAFVQVGGYPDVPLMEDAEFYRRLRRVGRVRQLPAYIVSSPRRYEQLGPVRTTAVYLLILILYLAKVPPKMLFVIYQKFIRRNKP